MLFKRAGPLCLSLPIYSYMQDFMICLNIKLLQPHFFLCNLWHDICHLHSKWSFRKTGCDWNWTVWRPQLWVCTPIYSGNAAILDLEIVNFTVQWDRESLCSSASAAPSNLNSTCFSLVLKSIGYKSVPVDGLPFDKYRGRFSRPFGSITSGGFYKFHKYKLKLKPEGLAICNNMQN